MSRYYKRKFVDDYAKLRERIDRDYGQRAYGDKFKVETTGMLRQQEPDYELHFKPYIPEKKQKSPIEALEDMEDQQPETRKEKIESQEPIEVQEDFTPDTYENALQEAEKEILQSNKFEQLEPVDYRGEFISNEDIVKREKLRKLGYGNYERNAGSDHNDAGY